MIDKLQDRSWDFDNRLKKMEEELVSVEADNLRDFKSQYLKQREASHGSDRD